MADYDVLVISPLVAERIEEFEPLFADNDVAVDVLDTDHYLSESELVDALDGYDGVIAEDDAFTERVFRSADRLSVVSQCGVGTDNVDEAAAEEYGVETLNTPGVYNDEVADVVVGYALLLARRLHEVDRGVRNGEWPDVRGTTLAGKTFGVVGVGDIGSAVARRASAFGTDVVGHDVVPISSPEVESVELAEVFERSDFVSLHCPLTPETEGLVGDAELDALGEDGYLINTARGELVEEAALVDALRDDRIAGAALDVYEDEPLPADHPLTRLDSVVLGSHNAYNTDEAVERVTRRTVENLVDALGSSE